MIDGFYSAQRAYEAMLPAWCEPAPGEPILTDAQLEEFSLFESVHHALGIMS